MDIANLVRVLLLCQYRNAASCIYKRCGASALVSFSDCRETYTLVLCRIRMEQAVRKRHETRQAHSRSTDKRLAQYITQFAVVSITVVVPQSP